MSHLFPVMLMAAASQASGTLSEPATTLEPTQIVWTGSLPRPPVEDETLVILTPTQGERALSLRRPDVPRPTRLAPLPLFANLLAESHPVAFGSDGRCKVEMTEAGKHRLRCRPGESISGAAWVLEGRAPAGGALQAHLSTSGDPGFRAEMTGRGANAVAPKALRSGSQGLRLPAVEETLPAQLAVFAPRDGGTLNLDQLEIIADATASPRGSLAAWAWSAGLWATDPAGLVDAAKVRGVTRLFVSLEIDRGAVRDAAALGRFARLALASGVEVEAVEGDPRMVQAEGLRHALVRARAFAAYQHRAPVSERLAGIQYDVEPYILPGWGKGDESYEGWASAIAQLSAAAREPVDLVLPFWIASSADGARFLDRVAPATRMLTVMSYRTDAPVLSQIAEPVLAWGSRNAKAVRLSLEAGPIPDEVEEVFEPAAAGTLAVLPGDEPKVLLLASPGVIPGARMYRFHQRSTIRGAAQSFLGREAAMIDLARGTAPAFSAWPAFSGFALHGLSWSVDPKQPTSRPTDAAR